MFSCLCFFVEGLGLLLQDLEFRNLEVGSQDFGGLGCKKLQGMSI